jgi:hypothetical protein
MLQNDIPGMAALDKPIKEAEQDIDGLKTGLGEVMGANVHGASGNQLTGSGWFGRVMGLGETDEEELRAPNMGGMPAIGAKPGLHIGNSKPLFAANETQAHMTGMDDVVEYPPEPQAPPQIKDIPTWDDKVKGQTRLGAL